MSPKVIAFLLAIGVSMVLAGQHSTREAQGVANGQTLVHLRDSAVCATEDSITGDTEFSRGVMTDEVGVITGPVTLAMTWTAGQYTLTVRYQGSNETYTVTRCD